MDRDKEVFGLASGESGHTCENHEICGHHVAVRDLVKFTVVVLEEEGGGYQDQGSEELIWNRKVSIWLLASAHCAWEPKGGGGKQV
jgi:hypothetical protein